MLSRLRRNLAEANYGALALELIVVIVGILVAFQIDRWAEERRDRAQEAQYLERLRADLRFEVELMEQGIEFADSRIAAVRLLESIANDPSVAAEEPVGTLSALERATWRSFPHISAYVYTELQTTGNLSLIQSEALRKDLAEYYSYIRFESMIGLDLETQRQFARQTAGMLTMDELIGIEDRQPQQNDITAARAIAIAEEFAMRREAVNLLPSIAQHHAFNRNVIENSRDKAKQIIATLDAMTEKK